MNERQSLARFKISDVSSFVCPRQQRKEKPSTEKKIKDFFSSQ